MDGGKPVGWCDRDSLLRSAADSTSGQQIGFIVRPGVACVSPETTIPDALELASARDERIVGTPLIVTDESGVHGTVAIGDLLHAAADLARDVQLRIAPLTGLPGRVLADEHLAAILGAAKSPYRLTLGSAEPRDVAMLNIRAFSRYNETLGYELGDELLRRVVDLFRSCVCADRPEIFFAHLENDRFLATAPVGTLQPLLESFLREFDSREQTAAGRDAHEPPRMRIVLAPEATRWLPSSQWLYRMTDKWNQNAHETAGRSELVIVREGAELLRYRESA